MTAHLVTQGIVLRETETKEADKILTVFTRDAGKISVIARGARRKSCRFAACAQLLNYRICHIYLEITVFVRAVHHMYQQICIFHLFKCGFERLDQAMRQLAYESHSIDQNEFTPVLHRYLSMLRIQRSEKHIL